MLLKPYHLFITFFECCKRSEKLGKKFGSNFSQGKNTSWKCGEKYFLRVLGLDCYLTFDVVPRLILIEIL